MIKLNVKHIDPEEWGIPYKEEVSWNALCFVWFVFGIALATLVLHFTVISPLLNQCV